MDPDPTQGGLAEDSESGMEAPVTGSASLSTAAVVHIPDLLYHVMGVWCLATAVVGVVANASVILLFMVTKQVPYSRITVRRKDGTQQLKRSFLFIQLRTPFNYVLVNLSMIDLFIAITGDTVLGVGCVRMAMVMSRTVCGLNAFGMTFLGNNAIRRRKLFT